jgi:hypothetical protein
MPLLPDTWTVKEVVADLKSDLVSHLNKQDEVLTAIDRKIEAKADKADVIALGGTLTTHIVESGIRLTTLEEHRASVEMSRRFRNRVWAVAGSVATLVVVILAALISGRVI